jgi:hypothetical protein
VRGKAASSSPYAHVYRLLSLQHGFMVFGKENNEVDVCGKMI